MSPALRLRVGAALHASCAPSHVYPLASKREPRALGAQTPLPAPFCRGTRGLVPVALCRSGQCKGRPRDEKVGAQCRAPHSGWQCGCHAVPRYRPPRRCVEPLSPLTGTQSAALLSAIGSQAPRRVPPWARAHLLCHGIGTPEAPKREDPATHAGRGQRFRALGCAEGSELRASARTARPPQTQCMRSLIVAGGGGGAASSGRRIRGVVGPW